MQKERNKAVPASYVIFEREGKILLGKRQNTTYYDGWYGLPAGHVEFNELPKEAAIREAKEEVGLDVNKEDLEFVHLEYRIAHDETGDRTDNFFRARKWRGEPKIIEADKCTDLQWFDINNLPENMIHHEKQVLEKIRVGIIYSEVNKEHTVKNPNIK